MSRVNRHLPLLESAIAAARAAGEIQLRRAGTAVVSPKGQSDIATDVDLACERAIVEVLRSRHPDHAILSEEGHDSAGSAPYRWIVDPLDGTKNYAHGLPRSCASVAVAEGEEVVAGAVFNPHTGELFAASAAGGATLNGAPIRVSPTPLLSRALVASGLNQIKDSGPRRADRAQLERLARLLDLAEGVRAPGCCALDLCDVACGRFDAFFESGLQPWDMAAGALIVREAGGTVSGFEGARHSPSMPHVLASNGRIHRELLALL
jgi:myo-inositol-1(or 4)-monophosphatase